VALVFVVALALRLGHLLALQSGFAGTALFSTPLVDAAHHWNEAQRILHEDFWLRDGVPWKGPGYSYFLAALAALSGSSVGVVRWVLAVLGAVNCALLVLLARRLLPVGWSAAAGLLAAVNGILIAYDGELYFPTLLIALNLPVFFLLTRPGAASVAHAGAGALLGLACVVHPAYLLPAAALTPWIWRRGRRLALIWLLALAATIAPVTLTNIFIRGQPVLISWNGGVNLYAANHPTYDQRAGNATFAWGRVLNTPLDAGIEGEAARDRTSYRLAARQVLRHPVETAGGLLHKAFVFVSPPEIASNFRIYQLREHSPVLAATLGRWGPLWLPFGLWGPVALLGLGLLLRRPAPLTVSLALWSLGVMGSCLLFFNTARYRAPLVFFGCIWVAAALHWGWQQWRGRRFADLGVGVAIVLVAAVALAVTAAPQRDLPPPLEYYEAQTLLRAGRADAMDAWAQRALRRDPDSPALLLFVADLYGKAGRPDRQRELLQRMLALPDLEPDAVDVAHEHLAQGYAAEGRFEDARRELRAAIAVGADSAEWRGYPYYQMDLGPTRACWLRLAQAELEIALGFSADARDLIATVRHDCPDGARYRTEIARLERGLGDAVGTGSP
jgi:tetratricopeptide (TPR) repeat protein